MNTYEVKVRLHYTDTYTIEAYSESDAHQEALEQAIDDVEMVAETWTTHKEEEEEENEEEEDE
tara:strand:+ start:966 stop:1154 length:189 start_codon:yes stop_codon:yes gene_type:complete